MRPSVRTILVLQGVAVAAAVGVVVLGLGIPLAARHRLGAPALWVIAVVATLTALLLSCALLLRGVARPLERLLAAAGKLAGGEQVARGELPVLGEPGAVGLARAAIAFERLAAAFVEERGRLAAKVRELTQTNEELARARESLVRSERLATVGRLAAGLAHEVGNPLGAITGYVELGRSRLPPDADPELAGALARIGVAAERIDRTVRDLLAFARPAPPALTAVTLGAAVEGAIRLVAIQPRFRGVLVDVDVPPELPPVLGDEHQLSQVLVNLLLNAADAMETGGRVRVVAARSPRRPGEIELEVADDGPGIPPELLDRIFDPFFTTKEPGRGSGLGLAISHRIVESLGGALGAANVPPPGRGAVFTVRLRAAPSRGGGP